MKQLSDTDILLQRIANYLVINASFASTLGLAHGKMGIVIFFYHYARYSQNTAYEEFAGELLEEVYEDIQMDISVDFENGLCGIAWGIEYLKQHKFVDGDTAAILKDVDLRIMERDPRRINDLSFRSGLLGISFYVAIHVNSLNNNNTVFDSNYLMDMKQKVYIIEDSLLTPIKSFFDGNLACNYHDFVLIPELLFDNIVVIDEDTNWSNLAIGIEQGLSGIGLKIMNI